MAEAVALIVQMLGSKIASENFFCLSELCIIAVHIWVVSSRQKPARPKAQHMIGKGYKTTRDLLQSACK